MVRTLEGVCGLHHDVGVDFELVFPAGLFQGAFEEVSGRGGLEIREVVITTEVDGVVLAGRLVTLKADRHGGDCSGCSTRSLCRPSSQWSYAACVAHLRRRSLAAKVGGRWAGAVALSRDAHLSDDEAVAKMGHPDVGHPPEDVDAAMGGTGVGWGGLSALGVLGGLT